MANSSKGPGVNSEGLFSGIVKGIVGGATNVGAGIAKGVSSIAAAMGVPPAMVAGVSAVLLTASVAGGMGAMSADDLARVTSKPDCRETYQAAQVAGASALDDMDADVQKRENARIIYSVLKTYNPNLSDAHIAAALSNWEAEGGIDPTSIEGIYDEHYQVGPKKQAAMSDDLASWTEQHVLRSPGVSYNVPAYFASEPGHYMCGMGMAQHTGNGAWAFLSAARSLGVEWSDMAFNIAYNIYTGSPCGGTPPGCPKSSEFWDYYQNVEGTPEEICHWFTQYYEGNKTYIDNHDDSLDKWLKECATFQVDKSAANSALSMLSTMGKTAVAASVNQAVSSCVRCTPKTAYGNSTIAEAAAAISWPTREESKNNKGTEVYQTVHDVVLPGEPLYMSCDRGACTAIRWSGADKDYPAGPCTRQMAYMMGEGKEKWQHVGTADTLKMEDLQPGDVFVTPGHTFIYVGEDAIKAVHGDHATKGANSVSASFNERSPAASTEATQVIGQDHDYHVFRNIKPDPDETYVHAYDSGSVRKSGSAASTSGSRGSCEEEDETTGAFGNEEAPAGSDAAKLVEAAKRVPSPGGGLCAAWVTNVFRNAGLNPPSGNANDMYAAHCHSNDRGQLKPGMIIAIDAHSMTEAGATYGHVGIYIGGGMVMDNVGEIRTSSVDKWCNDYNEYNLGGGVKWGWVNGQALC